MLVGPVAIAFSLARSKSSLDLGSVSLHPVDFLWEWRVCGSLLIHGHMLLRMVSILHGSTIKSRHGLPGRLSKMAGRSWIFLMDCFPVPHTIFDLGNR